LSVKYAALVCKLLGLFPLLDLLLISKLSHLKLVIINKNEQLADEQSVCDDIVRVVRALDKNTLVPHLH